MEYNSLYEMTRQDYTDRSSDKLLVSAKEKTRLIFQKYDEFQLEEDLEELNQLQEHDIYFS